MYEIESSRTYLRRFSMADLDSVAKMESDHDVMKSTGPGRALSRNESEERLVKIIDSEEMDLPLGIWAAILKENHKVVGWFMLKKTSYDYPELGFMLSKKYWNKGLSTEVAQALINYGFESVKLEKIVAVTDLGNLASIKVLEKIGFNLKKSISCKKSDTDKSVKLNYFELSKLT